MSDKITLTSELKQKWVKALRSGEYKQGRGSLRTPENEFCCLGVLCDVVDPQGWGEVPNNIEYFEDYLYDDLEEVDDIRDIDNYEFPNTLEEAKFCAHAEFEDKGGWVYGSEADASWEVLPGFISLTPSDTNHARVLMDMNDTQKRSFAEIADYIEENL